MKATEKNISRRANGTLYFVSRRKGKLLRVSLGTSDLCEARSKIARMLASSIMTAREPQAVPLLEGNSFNQSVVPLQAPETEVKPLVAVITLANALVIFEASQICLSKGQRDMMKAGSRVVAKYCKDLESFNPAAIWSAYRNTGKGSACNHLRWWLRNFVPYAIKRGWLTPAILDDLGQIPLIKVNSRKIRIPSMKIVDEFLQMVESEDQDAGDFLRFLTTTGLRREGANLLAWEDVDFTNGFMKVLQKGGEKKQIPVTPEALKVLLGRHAGGHQRPFGFSDRRHKQIGRLMKRMAKGMEIDLTFYHAFRHYFSSRALMAGLGVQDVAVLLGHSDRGQLVLQTYGHLTSEHLKKQVAGLRLARAE